MQQVGAPVSQEYMVRVEAKTEDQSFQANTEAKVQELLGAKYGPDQIILLSSNFVGPRLAQGLVTQTLWLVLIAVLLILAYMMFRFHPPIYAMAAVIGICHDALVMIGFDAVFRVQVDAATIAAILTILGYSINDTIVIFDRVRENKNLMRGTALRTILDTSVTQTLSRTFITSGATLLTVIALFILTSGSIKNFALNMIIGILEGTYSTFISSFIVLEWTKMSDRRHKRLEMEKYGVTEHQAKLTPVLAEGAFVDAQEEPESGRGGSGDQCGRARRNRWALRSPCRGPLLMRRSRPLSGPSPSSQGQAVAQHAGVAPSLFGHSGSRKNKKHKKRHH